MSLAGPTPNEVLNDWIYAVTAKYASIYHIEPLDLDIRWVPQVGHIALKVMHVMRGTTPLQVIEEIPNSSLNVKQEKVNEVVAKAILAAFERICDIRGLKDAKSTETPDDTGASQPKRGPGRPRANKERTPRRGRPTSRGSRSDSRTQFVEDQPSSDEDDQRSDQGSEGDQVPTLTEET